MPRITRPDWVPTYTKHKPSGRARVRIDGQDIWLGKHGTIESVNAYNRVIAEWKAQAPTPNAAPRGTSATTVTRRGDPGITVTELLAAFWQHAGHYYRKNGEPTGTLANIRKAFARLRPLYGATRAADFGPLTLQAFRQSLIAEKNEAGEQRLSRGTVNYTIAWVKAAFKWGVAQELVPPSIHHALATVGGIKRGRGNARETAPVRPVSDRIVEATLEHAPPIIADMARLQRLTGARPGEICQLTAGGLDTSGRVWTFTPEHHKTEHLGHARVICIGPRGQEILKRYLQRDMNAPLFSPAEAEAQRRARQHAARKTPAGYGNTIGTNRRPMPKRTAGSAYTTSSYGRAIARACDEAFPAPKGTTRAEFRTWRRAHRWSPNQLRHTAATEIRKTFGLDHAGAALGHANLDTTLIYAERERGMALAVAAKLG